MRPTVLGFLLLWCVLARIALAGDAVAIGYAPDGAWTAVTYNRSSTPKGGPHYHEAAQACAFAIRDLWVRASDNLVRTEIVGRSDKTGFVAVARGRSLTRNKDVTAIGRGKSQPEADQNALKKLIDRDATTDEQIVYQYFSYGEDSGLGSRARRKTTHGRRVATSALSTRKT
jgi:hypothetical protein